MLQPGQSRSPASTTPTAGDFRADDRSFPAVVANTGGSQPHENMSPFLVLNFIIALQGVFPSQN